MYGLPETLHSFAGKWIAAEPELGLALSFLDPSQRAAQAAYACLQREISHAALAIRESDVANAKLGWWLEELQRSKAGEPRHPLTEVLCEWPGFADVSAATWQGIVLAAVELRERESAADLATMLAASQPLMQGFAEVEARLFGAIDIAATAQIAAHAQALRELSAISLTLETGHLPLPLDLLARHQLNRDGVSVDSTARRLALRGQAGGLAVGLDHLVKARPALGLIRRAGLIADRSRARRAAKSDDPSVSLAVALRRLPFGTAWGIWRAARR